MIKRHLSAFVLAIGVAHAVSIVDSPIACNLKALTQAERVQDHQLTRQWQSAILDRRELSNGYVFRIDGSKIALTDLAQWISLEHKCCPFFRFRLEVDETNNLSLALTGGKGVKEFVAANTPSRQR